MYVQSSLAGELYCMGTGPVLLSFNTKTYTIYTQNIVLDGKSLELSKVIDIKHVSILML